MKAYIFEAPWPTGPKTNFFERSDLYLLGKLKKIGFAALFRVLWIGQSTIKLYHKKQIDSERLAQTVHLILFCSAHNFLKEQYHCAGRAVKKLCAILYVLSVVVHDKLLFVSVVSERN